MVISSQSTVSKSENLISAPSFKLPHTPNVGVTSLPIFKVISSE
jgi:hypothetical protein